MKLRPNNIDTFSTPDLENMRDRCKIMLDEALRDNEEELFLKNDDDIVIINKELNKRAIAEMEEVLL